MLAQTPERTKHVSSCNESSRSVLACYTSVLEDLTSFLRRWFAVNVGVLICHSSHQKSQYLIQPTSEVKDMGMPS